MIIKQFDTNEEWLEARRGKITGSRLNDIYSPRGAVKMGFYELIAEKLALAPDGENVMERGHRLEEEAVMKLEEELGIELNKSLVMWEREDNSSIAISPDAFTDDLSIACEVKCLGSAKHIKAYIEKQIEEVEYRLQAIQYFVVNDKLEKLYFCFYDPRLCVKQFFYLTFERKDIQEDINKYLEFQRKQLEEVDKIVKELSF